MTYYIHKKTCKQEIVMLIFITLFKTLYFMKTTTVVFIRISHYGSILNICCNRHLCKVGTDDR